MKSRGLQPAFSQFVSYHTVPYSRSNVDNCGFYRKEGLYKSKFVLTVRIVSYCAGYAVCIVYHSRFA
jgi:hypothetical protein